MELDFHKSFVKDIAKFSSKIQKQAEIRINLFLEDKFHPLLNYHALKGDYKGYFSINVTADVRILFYIEDQTMYLIRIGTHSQLYG